MKWNQYKCPDCSYVPNATTEKNAITQLERHRNASHNLGIRYSCLCGYSTHRESDINRHKQRMEKRRREGKKHIWYKNKAVKKKYVMN